mgnify:CR=1 FL=1
MDGLQLQNLIKILDQDLLLLSTRARFILDVINDMIKVRNIPEAEIIKQLHTCKYSIMVDNVLFEYEKNDYLCREGELVKYVLFLVNGEVKVKKRVFKYTLQEKRSMLTEFDNSPPARGKLKRYAIKYDVDERFFAKARKTMGSLENKTYKNTERRNSNHCP